MLTLSAAADKAFVSIVTQNLPNQARTESAVLVAGWQKSGSVCCEIPPEAYLFVPLESGTLQFVSAVKPG